MAALPSKESFTDTAVTQQGFRNALDQLRDYLAGVLDEAGTPAAARQALGLSDAATTSVAAIRNGLIPKGARMVFYQAAAPTGWTQVTTVNDRVLRVVSGSGGGSGGAWSIAGLSASTSISVQGHALTEDQIPPHAHWGGDNNFTAAGRTAKKGVAGGVRVTGGAADHDMWSFQTERTGGGQPHAHGASASTSVSHSGSWRPAYIDVIVCERN